MIKSVKDFAGAFDAGKSWFSSFRKLPAVTTTAGIWFDLSMAPGNPKPNYYTGAELTATVLEGRNGMYHGENVSPQTKMLSTLMITTPAAALVPAAYALVDYLLFYPLIDMDSTDAQLFDNTVTLPRYTDGEGVMAFIVATNPYIGGATYTISYTNSEGTSGRTSQAATCNTGTNISSLVSGGSVGATRFAPYVPLQSGDRGIRSVESITFSAPNGGLAALVLCKPLAKVYTREITAPHEKSFIVDNPAPPVIEDGAYLNMLVLPNGTFSGNIVAGYLETVWG